MLICRIMVIGCVAALVSTLHVDDGCEAKSEWEEQIKWHEYHIRAWTSKNEQTLLEMTFGFKAMAIESDKDTIKLSRNGYKFIRTRDLTPNSQMHNISASMTDGWNEFMLSVDGNYTLRYIHLNNSYMLFTEKVDFKLQSITLQGSNITLNCPEKLRLWHVSGKPVTVPLSNATEHQLSFYSDEEMMPSIKLGSRKYPLSWDGQGVTTLNKGPLPPFRLHNITISCSSSERDTCIIMANGEKTLEVVPMDRMLQSVAVERRDGEPFTIILTDPHIALREIDPLTTTQPPSDDGATTIIGVLMIITAIAIVVIFMVVYHFKIKKLQKTTGNDGEMLNKIDDIKASKPLLDPQRTVQQISKNELLLEVIQNNPHKVKQLIQGKQQNDSEEYKEAYLEAHLLCRSKITKLFDCNSSMQRETLIRNVLDTFNLRVDQVFEATKKGIYNQGVLQLLQYYELPATIRNSEGHSLLHIIASSKGVDGFPVWNTVNLQTFLKIPSVYANAVDFKGKTCLHHLAEAAENTKTNKFGNENMMTSESAWVAIANKLMEFGCDPRIKDDADQLPQDYAKHKRNLKLTQCFKKKCETSSISKDMKATFDELVEYLRKGDMDALMKTLPVHQEFLQLNYSKNLLTLSVTLGNFETTMLLLSAGAWRALCGQPYISVTSLEAVHKQESLPALFAAVIRRECLNRLRFENDEVGQDQNLETLSQHLKQLMLAVEEGVPTKFTSNKWQNGSTEDSREARKLLYLAAGHGLPFTCQMIGLENVNLQPYPNEEKPTIIAIKNGHKAVIRILYRDLQLSAFAHSDTGTIPSCFLDDVFNYELCKLEKECKNTKQKECLQSIKDLPCATEKIEVENRVLSFISKLGLVYIFHKLKMNNKGLDVNARIDELTGCTLLHIAAMYGRFSMVEYLLYDEETDIMAKSKGGFTAAHLAAIRGHKECMEYLQFCMKEDARNPNEICDSDHTASQFLEGYRDLVKESEIVLLSGKAGVKVLSAPSLEEKTEISLQEKYEQFQITDVAKFLSFLGDMKGEENIREHILDEMTTLLQKVSEADDKLEGSVVTYHCNSTGLNIPTESMQIYCEVTSQTFNASIKHKESDGNCSVTADFASDELGNNLTNYFYDSVRVTLKDFRFKSSAFWLLYPAIIKEPFGVTLLFTMFENGKSRLVSVLLVPVLKTDYPKENIVNFNHQVMQDVKPMVYLAKQSKNWVYITVKMEDDILSQLTREHRLVLAGCMMLTRMLFSCWWFPQQESRRHSRTWQSYSCSLKTLPDRVLTSLFLEEVNCTNDEDWNQTKIVDRMISVFSRATETKNNLLYPKDNVRLFLDCKHSSFKPNKLVRVIQKFLENLKTKTT